MGMKSAAVKRRGCRIESVYYEQKACMIHLQGRKSSWLLGSQHTILLDTGNKQWKVYTNLWFGHRYLSLIIAPWFMRIIANREHDVTVTDSKCLFMWSGHRVCAWKEMAWVRDHMPKDRTGL